MLEFLTRWDVDLAGPGSETFWDSANPTRTRWDFALLGDHWQARVQPRAWRTRVMARRWRTRARS